MFYTFSGFCLGFCSGYQWIHVSSYGDILRNWQF